MHTLTFVTKFNFGDRVRFSSFIEKKTGTGAVFAIMLDKFGQVSYMVDTTPDAEYNDTLQPGLLENEMSLLDEQD